MNMRSILVLVCWPFFVSPSFAGDHEIAELCDRLKTVQKESGIPAMGIVLATSLGVASICTSGERVIGAGILVQNDDPWDIGSTAKAMTSALVARLVENGVVDWDDTVGEVIGDLVPSMDPGYESLTYRHLLSHRAGLPFDLADWEHDQFAGNSDHRDLVGDRLIYAKLVLDEPPGSKAGAQTEYSNAGYVIAGTMLETSAGKSFETLLQEELFASLEITSARIGAPENGGKIDAPRGHGMSPDGKALVAVSGIEATNVPVGTPAGAIRVSLEDYSRFLVDQLRGARRTGDTFLGYDSYEILHSPPFGFDTTTENKTAEGYAMGWVVRDDMIYHSGDSKIWLALTVIWPEKDRLVAVVANDGRGQVVWAKFEELIEFAKHLPIPGVE